MSQTIHVIADAEVDEALDADLRGLLSACFTGPDDHVFKVRRYFNEPPRWRWFMRKEGGGLAAHVAAHDKCLGHAGGELRIAGIAEVAVHPDCRGRGLAKLLLERLHRDCATFGVPWAALFGKAEVYRSSGYTAPGNILRYRNPKTGAWSERIEPNFQVCRLRDDAPPWPTGGLDLRGSYF